MRTNNFLSRLNTAVRAGSVLLFAAVAAFGQQQVNLTAAPSAITMPDGNSVPMWGYHCGALGTGIVSSATCAYLAGPTSPAAVGALGAISVINGGSGYTAAPAVTITPAAGNTPTTAASAVATVADGQVVSISLTNAGAGYTAAPTVTIGAPTTGTTATANAGLAWSPVVITVPTGAAGGLQINLTNQLYSLVLTPTTAGSVPVNPIPTSIMITGQVGGGLGMLAQRTTLPSPDHSNAQGTYTWVNANLPGNGTPPLQGARVLSLATEVLPVAATALTGEAGTPCALSAPTAPNAPGSCALTWSNLRPGTYLLESGTHPSIQAPMGLIGMLVVTCAPGATTCGTGVAAGTAYPAVTGTSPAPAYAAVTYNAEIPLEFSEIDPVQNNQVNIAVNTAGFSETAVWNARSTGPLTSAIVWSGGSGYNAATTSAQVVGANGTGATATLTITGGIITGATITAGGSGYSPTNPANILVTDSSLAGSGAIITAVTSPNALGCGDPSVHSCYPPAVNYTPFYYLINGVAFNKTNAALSNFPAAPATGVTAGTGTVLARLVNAGLRMHVPSIVGSQTAGFSGAGASATVGGFTLVAEDGNVVPNLLPNTNLAGQVAAPKVQTDVFMAAGKVYDVMINAPATATSLPIYDRQLSLSGNSSERDAGMLAYISVNGALLPTFGAGIAGTPVAVADSYPSLVACPVATPQPLCTPLVVSDVSKGVMANDSFVYGVELSVGPTAGMLACGSTGTTASSDPGLCANGTFIYTPNPGTTMDSFSYCANGTTTVCATVTLSASTNTSTITMNNITYTAKTAGYIKIAPPGVLSVDSSTFPLTVVTTGTSAPTTTCTSLSIQPDGGFIATASATTAGSCTINYTATNTEGTTGAAVATINFPAPSNLSVKVVDGVQYKACGGDPSCIAGLTPITDYRWLIQEDKTFYVNPACATTAGAAGGTAACPVFGTNGVPATFGVNFHTSFMDFIAQGCTGATAGDLSCEYGQTVGGVPAICEVGNGVCVPAATGQVAAQTSSLPSQVTLDPGCGFGTAAMRPGVTCTVSAPYPKRYYLSAFPGDAGNPFTSGYAGKPQNCYPPPAAGTPRNTQCGHGMGGAEITWNTTTSSWNPVIVLSEPSPYPPAKLSVSVFEDDFPLNGEQDAGGGIDVLATNEPGLGGFEIILWDAFAQPGDVTGQLTHDMFNQPLSNSLAGTIDPATQLDACPISAEVSGNVLGKAGYTSSTPVPGGVSGPDQAQGALTGLSNRIVTCPKYESDGMTLSPLVGQAIVVNMMPGKYIVQAYPGASRIAAGEEWLQTNTLDGQHPHDAFLKISEPSYFQEYGPAGFHVSIGFANPKIINARRAGVCNGSDLNISGTNCTNTVTGRVTAERLSRPPDERLYSSGSHDAFYWTQCWVSLGDPDGEDFAFTKCDANGNFTLTAIPSGSWRLTIGDQWNDQIIDGLSTPINVANGNNQTINMGDVGVQQWQANVYTRTCIDDNRDGICESTELGIPFINNTVRYRNGVLANNLLTDFTGTANFNETFPLFNWYVVESDTLRYKTTGIHTVYDAGGPADGTLTTCGGTQPGAGFPSCGPAGTPYAHLANTIEPHPVPANLSVPGAIYCTAAQGAGCTGASINTGTGVSSTGTAGSGTLQTNQSTGRIDPPWVAAEGYQGFTGQNNFIEFAKVPYCAGTGTALGECGATAPATAAENGGIHGHVIYASTRPFDDPQMLVQTQWTSTIPRVTINLYQESFAADSVTPTLTLVDTTHTSSWDDFAQGFRSDGIPNMNCPGQAPAPTSSSAGDLFFYTLFNQPNYLNLYNYYYSGAVLTPLPANSQYKCYDAMHNWNQLQPAPYDGMYQFPSVLGIIPSGTGAGHLNTTLTGGVPGGANGAVLPANMGGTNCTICIANPDTTDPWRVGTPMLPPGKYVVEVVLPSGFELVKEEDKNILIGDNFIAPVYQSFGFIGDIFIIPDQASVASQYDTSGTGYNKNNAQDPTQSLGMSTTSQIVPAYIEPVWPCVGQLRQVPDYMSLFPQAHQVAAFAGAYRHLCDRKEVTLGNQMSATAKFWLYTSTHIADVFTGVITDDFTSEFDPFAPVFGEKFAPPNMPVSTRDWVGNEVSRVYSDHWGAFNGMTYSTWEVNPPNPTGYAPTVMVQCMNDKGPAIDFRPTIVNSAGLTVPNPNYGMMASTDPLYNPLYSDFCYELPYLPGQTEYLDTPVVPTSAFVGAGYNNADCDYPANTPAISEVDGDGVGPYVSAAGHTITITALGDQIVNNYGYSGPQAITSPFNQKTVTRHYGFGTSPTVTIGGIATSCTGNDLTLTCTVPSGVPDCAVQQQAQYSGSTAQCGELVITASNGQRSIDTVTITVGGKAPTHVGASQSIQAAIDAAAPGDLIMVDPTCTTTAGTTAACTAPSTTNIHTPSAHREIVLMWKPVRLQGVGAASSIIDASTHPAGALKLDPWRASVNCLFGLALNGQPNTGTGGNQFDPTGTSTCPAPGTNGGIGPDGNPWNFFNGGPNTPTMVVDRVPLEGILGWDATVNGNLAEQLQEPSLMGAYEGAGVTVLGKGVNIPPNSSDAFGSGAEASFPSGTTLLTVANCAGGAGGANQYPSNFLCNPSRIDGIGITDSSQGGGGIFVHAWAHNLQIANNRVFNNTGTLSGGMSIGLGESPEAYLNGTTLDSDPGSCLTPGGTFDASFPLNTQLPFCFNANVNIHNNAITRNASTGDELFTGTPAGAGGATICTGADYYRFNYNWVCGNISTGDGGGIGHLGFIWNGDIEHNTIIFNQATNPSITSNGGGLIVMGAAPDGQINISGNVIECGSVTDNDCAPGLSDGTGPGLIVNANLFQGNAADSGSGGAIRLQAVNGTDIPRFPANPERWYSVLVTNNIIDNNVAGWDGAGMSLEDALAVQIANNTIASNDTTASSGVLFNTLGAPLASSQSPSPLCQAQNGGAVSCPQPAELVVMQNSPQLISGFVGLDTNGQPLQNGGTPMQITCPPGNYAPLTSAINGTCTKVSYPALYNNIFWQNRSFQVGVGALGGGQQNQQNVVTLYNASFTGGVGSKAASQTSTGFCPAGSSYWDIGVRNDTGPGNHGSGFTLNPLRGVLTSTSGYSGTNSMSAPPLVHQYCNGSRVPPEATCLDAAGQTVPCGWQVPPGISDAIVPNPVFSLTPTATVDEGNNWVNMSWGPLSMVNPVTSTGTTNVMLGNYALSADSPTVPCLPGSSPVRGCIETIGASGVTTVTAPGRDFFGNNRPDPGPPNMNPGAVEFGGFMINPGGPTLTSIAPSVGSLGEMVPVILTGTGLTGGTITITGGGVTITNLTVVSDTQITATFTIAGNAQLSTRDVSVTTPSGASNVLLFTVATLPLPVLNQVVVPTAGVSPIPPTAPQGTTVSVALLGQGFPSGTTTATGSTINLCTAATGTCTLPAGVSVAVIPGTVPVPAPTANTLCGTANLICTVVDASTIELSLTIAPTAATGTFYIGVTTAGGATTRLPFVITAMLVRFSAPSPALNTGGTSAKTGIITVTNIGTTAIGLIAPPSVVPVTVPNATALFSITGGTCNVAPFPTINAGGSCTIFVTYTPCPLVNGVLACGPNPTGTATAYVSVQDALLNFNGNTFPAN